MTRWRSEYKGYLRRGNRKKTIRKEGWERGKKERKKKKGKKKERCINITVLIMRIRKEKRKKKENGSKCCQEEKG